MKSTMVDLNQRTMLLKEKDRNDAKKMAFGRSARNGCDSDDTSVERENETLKSQMRQLDKRSQARDEELMSA